MDGPHDLGGKPGFGLVPYSEVAAPFRARWEGRAFALANVAGMNGVFGTPEFRHAMERIEPRRYLSSNYFDRWNFGVGTLLVEKGVLAAEELSDAAGGSFPLSAPVLAEHHLDPGPNATEPRFRVGDEVRVQDVQSVGHTRCPAYVRGKRGSIIRSDGPSNFDDAEAHSDGKRLEPLYCVCFEGTELWGPDADASMTLRIDLFDCYLEAR